MPDNVPDTAKVYFVFTIKAIRHGYKNTRTEVSGYGGACFSDCLAAAIRGTWGEVVSIGWIEKMVPGCYVNAAANPDGFNSKGVGPNYGPSESLCSGPALAWPK
jgi:hypothetical protein